MNKSHSIEKKPLQNSRNNCIDDMDALLDHINEFSQLVQSHDGISDKSLTDEWNLFKTYIKWQMEDLTEYSHIYTLPRHKHNS